MEFFNQAAAEGTTTSQILTFGTIKCVEVALLFYRRMPPGRGGAESLPGLRGGRCHHGRHRSEGEHKLY